MLHIKDLYRQALDQRVKWWQVTPGLAVGLYYSFSVCTFPHPAQVQIKKFVRALLLLPNLRFYSGMVESAVMVSACDLAGAC
jgi:hypothetical protein